MYHHIMMLMQYMHCVSVGREVIGYLQAPKDKDLLLEALTRRSSDIDALFHHLTQLSGHKHHAHYRALALGALIS